MDIVCSTVTNVPLESAFAYYCEQGRLHEWIVGGGIREFTPITPPPKKVGSRFRMTYRLLGKTMRSVLKIKALDPQGLSVKEQVTGDYKAYRYELHFARLAPEKTRLEMRVHAVLPWGPLGRVAELLGWRLVRRDMEGGLQRFKTRVEKLAGEPAFEPHRG